jgi:LemA protein
MALFSIAFVCLCAAAAFAMLRAYRRLLALDASCDAAAAEVEAELASRHALLPALVGVMRAFVPHERDAVDAVARNYAATRRAASPQARLLAEARLGDGVRRALSKAQSAEPAQTLRDFRELEAVLEETERRLAAARRRQSMAIDAYNAALSGFPASLFAMRLNLRRRVFYDIGAERVIFEEAAA